MKTLARIILVFLGLLLIGAGLFLLAASFNLFPGYSDKLLSWAGESVLLISGGVTALVGLIMLSVGLRSPRRKTPSATLKGSEYGEVLISLDAIENMVLRVIQQHDGIKEVSRKVASGTEGLLVRVQIKVMPDIPLPNLIGELQGKIKTYLEEITGIAVQEVKVMVDNVISEPQPVKKDFS